MIVTALLIAFLALPYLSSRKAISLSSSNSDSKSKSEASQVFLSKSIRALQVYQNIGLKDKERYRRELKEYKDKLKLRQEAMEVEPNIKDQDVRD